jgi:hypothetical protein
MNYKKREKNSRQGEKQCITITTNTSQKPRLHGLALAFQQGRPGQSHYEAVIRARLGLAYFGSAWLGSRPQAGPEEHYLWGRIVCIPLLDLSFTYTFLANGCEWMAILTSHMSAVM